MKYFSEKEFHGFFNVTSEDLKVKLDKLREELDCPMRLSNTPTGIGRYLGVSHSQHNIDRWGEVRAVDGYIPEGISYKEFFKAAMKVGFTGIGIYTGWRGGRGFHVDVRDKKGIPAQWGGVYDTVKNNTKYVSISSILASETV